MAVKYQTNVVASGFVFPECPRWHAGALWFCDMEENRVLKLAADGTVHEIARLPVYAAGLGWSPAGDLLIVGMQDQTLYRLRADGSCERLADLSAAAISHCNDMTVGGDGQAYIGTFGFDYWAGEEMKPGALVSVSPAGEVSRAAEGLMFPNASAITPDGGTLIVAESFGKRLLALAVRDDGTLGERRVWAEVEGHPDGMCLDEENAVWVAMPMEGKLLRVAEGGEVLAEAMMEGGDAVPIAVMLGGPHRRTLYVVTPSAGETLEERRATRNGTVQSVEVEIAGAGWP